MEGQQYAHHFMENPNSTQTKSSKKKLRFFSKSKSKRSEYEKTNQCFCEECMRTVVNPNNYMIRGQQMANPYYYPIENQSLTTQSLSAQFGQQQQLQTMASNPEEHTYMEVSERVPNEAYVERIYPPPKQFPCECNNCMKKRGTELTTELLPLDTQIPLQMMDISDSAVLCNIL